MKKRLAGLRDAALRSLFDTASWTVTGAAILVAAWLTNSAGVTVVITLAAVVARWALLVGQTEWAHRSGAAVRKLAAGQRFIALYEVDRELQRRLMRATLWTDIEALQRWVLIARSGAPPVPPAPLTIERVLELGLEDPLIAERTASDWVDFAARMREMRDETAAATGPYSADLLDARPILIATLSGMDDARAACSEIAAALANHAKPTDSEPSAHELVAAVNIAKGRFWTSLRSIATSVHWLGDLADAAAHEQARG